MKALLKVNEMINLVFVILLIVLVLVGFERIDEVQNENKRLAEEVNKVLMTATSSFDNQQASLAMLPADNDNNAGADAGDWVVAGRRSPPPPLSTRVAGQEGQSPAEDCKNQGIQAICEHEDPTGD